MVWVLMIHGTISSDLENNTPTHTTILSPSNHPPPVRLELARYWKLLQENIWVQLELFQESWVNWACTGRKSVEVCIQIRRVECAQLGVKCTKSLGNVNVKKGLGWEYTTSTPNMTRGDSSPLGYLSGFLFYSFHWIILTTLFTPVFPTPTPLPFPYIFPLLSSSLLYVFMGTRDKVKFWVSVI